MAEKKISDIVYGVIFGVFFLSAFAYIVIDFDSTTSNSEGIGSNIEGVKNSSFDEYVVTERNVQDISFNSSSYSIQSLTDVDPRGTSQVITLAKDSPSTIKNFISNVAEFIPLNKAIIILLGSVIIITSITLLLRFIRPGGA